MGGRGQRAGLLAALTVALSPIGCTEPLDTTRTAPARGTLGEEIYKVVCQRIAAEELPRDVSGRRTRALCEGREGPGAAPEGAPRLRALAEQRDRLVTALDRVLPAELEDDLDRFLLQLLPFYDPPRQRLPSQTRAVADLLSRIVASDDALGALERLGARDGYRPLRIALGITRPLLAYPEFDSFATQALDTIDDDGAAGAQWDALLRATALDMATAGLDDPEPGPSKLALTRDLLLSRHDVFRQGSARFLSRRDSRGLVRVASEDGAVPEPFVDRDGDGLADVNSLGHFVGPDGERLQVPTPFPVAGGDPDAARDAMGRALRPDGTPLYEYVDVDGTMLAGLAREARELVDPEAPALLDMAYGLPVLLGPEQTRSAELGEATLPYEGFDTEQGALFDVLHALGTLLSEPVTDDALALAERLLREQEDAVAAVIEAGHYANERAEGTGAHLEPDAELWDDQLQVATDIAQQPGLLEALLRAFTDARTRRMGPIFAELMQHRDSIGLDPSDMNRPRRRVTFRIPVDRSEPNVADNHSLYQRTKSIIHDLNGVKICNKAGARLVVDVPWFGTRTVPFLEFGECELLEIENVAETYAQAIIGRAELGLKDPLLGKLVEWSDETGVPVDRILEYATGIDGLTTSPTPEALNRLCYTSHNETLRNLVDPPTTRDGVPVRERHDHGAAFAWEREYVFCGDTIISHEELESGGCSPDRVERMTFYDTLTPLLEAFDDFDRRPEGRFLFADLITALHLHWPSPETDTTQSDDPDGKFFAYNAGGVRYEPIVADAFADCVRRTGSRCDEPGGRLTQRIHRLARVLDAMDVGDGRDGIDVLAEATERMLDPRRHPELTDRAGRRTTETNAGRRTVELSPMYLMLDGLNHMDEAFARAEAARHERWLAARGRMVDRLFTTACDRDECRMQNRRMHAMLLELLPFVRERIAWHRDRGDLAEWASTLDERAAETMGGPLSTALVRFIEAVQRDPEARRALAELLSYLLDDGSANDAFDTTVVALADLLQVLEDDTSLVPLWRVLADGMAPNAREAARSGVELDLDGSAMDETMNLLREINEVDDRRTLRHVMSNLVAVPEDGSGQTPLETIIDVIAEVNRATPGAETRMMREDYRATLGRTVEFLTDDGRGLERLYRVIQERELTE